MSYYSTTAGYLTASVREIGDYTTSGDTADDYISDGFLMRRVDAGYKAAYELFADADADRLTITSEVVVSSNTGSFPLPTDMYRLRGIDVKFGNQWIAIQRDDKSFLNSQPWELPYGTSVAGFAAGLPSRYRLQSDYAYVSPDAVAGTTFRISYIPIPATLTGSDQTIDSTAGVDQLIIWQAVRDCRVREDKTTSEADYQIKLATERVMKMGKDRDIGQPMRLEDPLRRRNWVFGRGRQR